jgi:hypothetical protein
MKFDTRDQDILDNIMIAREKITRPRIGDYVRFLNGKIERFSHDWDDSLQTSPCGSFFLYSGGNASFSGGLNPAIPVESLTLTEEIKDGEHWFFHHNSAGAGRGVYFKIPCRVYSTTAEYPGFLSPEVFSCSYA